MDLDLDDVALGRTPPDDDPEPPPGTPAHDLWEQRQARLATQQAAAADHARQRLAEARARIAQTKETPRG